MLKQGRAGTRAALLFFGEGVCPPEPADGPQRFDPGMMGSRS